MATTAAAATRTTVEEMVRPSIEGVFPPALQVQVGTGRPVEEVEPTVGVFNARP